MNWIRQAAILLESKIPFAVVTLIAVRGHAPAGAGAKLLVTNEKSFGTIGGGNLEATATQLAQQFLKEHNPVPQRHLIRLTESSPAEFGLQCCGGEVELLLEINDFSQPTIAIFGIGHVGLALATVLSVLEVNLVLIDSRSEMLESQRLAPVLKGQAEVKIHAMPIPELAVESLPSGAMVIVMTHDHAEDAAILDAVLRVEDLGFVGLIGSTHKWSRFQNKLRSAGHNETSLSRVQCPVGAPEIHGKSPGSIALAVASQLILMIEKLSSKKNVTVAFDE